MLTVTGKLLSVPTDNYTDANGQLVVQNLLVVMGNEDVDTTKVSLNSRQVKSGVVDGWMKNVGKDISIDVSIFTFKNGGFKLNAVGPGAAPFQHANSLSAAKTA